MNKFEKVIAIRDATEGVVNSFGEGTYMGALVPDHHMFKDAGIKNPCIKLDTGKYIWGFQCYWGSLEGFNKKKKAGQFTEVNLIELEEDLHVQPLEEEKIEDQ